MLDIIHDLAEALAIGSFVALVIILAIAVGG